MIKLREYARLLVENDLTPDAFDRKIKAAVETIFDVDNVRVKKSKEIPAPAIANSYFNSNLYFTYRNVPLNMNVHFYHLKFPSDELKGLSPEQWDDAKNFPVSNTPEDILKSSNRQVKLAASMTYHPYDDNEVPMEFDDISTNHIGSVEANNIRDLITKAKRLIDDLGDGGDDNGPDEPEPVSPTPTSGKLVTV